MKQPTPPPDGDSPDRPVLGLPVITGRHRAWTAPAARSQRMHRFTASLRQAVDDATASGPEGLAIGCLDAREVGEAVLEIREVRSRLRGLELALLARADSLEVSTAVDGVAAVDTSGWLAHRALVSPRAARRDVRLSRNLAADFSATHGALLAGDVDDEQAEVVVTAVKRLPADLDPLLVGRAESHLLDEARRLDADMLRRAGRHLLDVVDPEVAEQKEAERLADEEAAAARRTSYSSWDDGQGVTHIAALVPTRHGQMLDKAIAALANPGLADGVSRGLAVDEASGVAGPRPTPEVRGEAFCRLVETLDPARLPSSGGMSATVHVTMSLETLLGGLATATMETGADISPGQARRMACEAGLVPVVLGGVSQPLDLGRRRRLYSAPQRTAMAVRQSYRCAAEGCDRPTAWCEAHHLEPWSSGGRTDLDDGVLICGRHHTLAHDERYEVRRAGAGRVVITRKPRDVPMRH